MHNKLSKQWKTNQDWSVSEYIQERKGTSEKVAVDKSLSPLLAVGGGGDGNGGGSGSGSERRSVKEERLWKTLLILCLVRVGIISSASISKNLHAVHLRKKPFMNNLLFKLWFLFQSIVTGHRCSLLDSFLFLVVSVGYLVRSCKRSYFLFRANKF